MGTAWYRTGTMLRSGVVPAKLAHGSMQLHVLHGLKAACAAVHVDVTLAFVSQQVVEEECL